MRLEERIRVNLVGLVRDVNIPIRGPEVALREADDTHEVHSADERHQLHIARGVEGGDVRRAAIEVVAILHTTYLSVEGGAAVARVYAEGCSPLLTHGVEHVVDEEFKVLGLLLRGRVVDMEPHSRIAVGKLLEGEVFHALPPFCSLALAATHTLNIASRQPSSKAVSMMPATKVAT